MDWVLRYVIQTTMGPWISFLVSLVLLPTVSLVLFILYRILCRVTSRPSGSERSKGGKIQWAVTKSTTFNDVLFVIGIAVLVGLWLYAQQTLYRQILQEEIANQHAAQSADNACSIVDNHPGRNTEFMDPGCKAAKNVLLTVDPPDQAYRRWFELLFSLNIWPWSDEAVAVAVPFGLGRLMLCIAIILFAREWLAPTVTSMKGFGNRMFRTTAKAA